MKATIGLTTCVSITLFLALAVLPVEATVGSDLYRVSITNQDDAESLTALNVDAILRIKGGYLVLVKPHQAELFWKTNVESALLAENVSRSGLALDARFHNRAFDEYELIFEEGSLRLFKVDPLEAFGSQLQENVIPLEPQKLEIIFKAPPVLDPSRMSSEVGLDSLATLIREDSLLSYLEALQAFDGRLAAANGDSRQWIYDKLVEFDCDSVYIDSFAGGVSKGGAMDGNVVAVKIGSLYPHHYVVFGAHFDAVAGSPGVDDNGSGTAGVMEMARVLKNVDTKMSFACVLYDSEEPRPFLRGSWYHASQMSKSEDSVVLMINMDMIGHWTNETHAKIMYGPDDTYAQLWSELADSLSSIDLIGLLYNDPSWDEYPYYQFGYDVLLVHEAAFSTEYHQPSDSVPYINIEYMARMIRSTLVTGFVTSETYTFTPGLFFSYPEGTPEILLPGITNSFLMKVEAYGGSSAVPGTGMLHYTPFMGGSVSVPMIDLGNNLYEATFPAFANFTRVMFRTSADEATLGQFFDYDGDRQYRVICATTRDEVLNDNFDSDRDWEVTGGATNGQWQRALPVPAFMIGNFSQPPCDVDGIGKCFLTGNDNLDSDVDNGHTILTSPVVDLSGGEATLEYYRWYSNDQGPGPNSDIFEISISNDSGYSWTLLESLGPLTGSSDDWNKTNLWIADYVTPTAKVMIRFDASDLDIGSMVEAAVDNVVFTRYTCDTIPPLISTTTLPDWTIGIPYGLSLEAAGGAGELTWVDRDNDLVGTGLGLSSEGLLSGVPSSTGEISFIALVADEYDSTDEHSYDFMINPSPIIETTTLPEAYVNLTYLVQLTGSGGTGTLQWTDRDDVLTNYNYTISATGLVSGLYSDTVSIPVTVRIEDEAGATYEQSMSLVCTFICGDVNADGEANVSDVTYYVDYLFLAGAAPVYMVAADVDASGLHNVADLTYLVNYLFLGGPDPVCE